jgi:hypothetical protein
MKLLVHLFLSSIKIKDLLYLIQIFINLILCIDESQQFTSFIDCDKKYGIILNKIFFNFKMINSWNRGTSFYQNAYFITVNFCIQFDRTHCAVLWINRKSFHSNTIFFLNRIQNIFENVICYRIKLYYYNMLFRFMFT